MASVPVPDIIEEGLRRLSARDLDSWLELFAEDARLHDLPDLPDAEIFEGHDGLRRWAQNNIELSEDWNWRLVACLAQQEGLVITETALEARGAMSDVPLSLVVFHVFQIDRSKIASVQAFSTRDQAFAAAGLRDPDA